MSDKTPEIAYTAKFGSRLREKLEESDIGWIPISKVGLMVELAYGEGVRAERSGVINFASSDAAHELRALDPESATSAPQRDDGD